QLTSGGLVRLPPTPTLVPPSPTCKLEPCATCRSERDAENTWREKAINGDALFRERSWSFNLFDNAHQVYKTSATKQGLIAKLTKKGRGRSCGVAEVRGSDSCSLRALLSPSDESAWLGGATNNSRICEDDVIEMHEHQSSLPLQPSQRAPAAARPTPQLRESVLTVSERAGASCRSGPCVSLIKADAA
ncbi:uncharacterized protein LOC122376111, partial [Amphibalanus amphitrite]|uniref:uncharacterized protein LOC122376111 n=1 Tax=Amphibalanus amphitrite TaxID=1232801 RepID=UPI001C90F7C8